jgi:molybdopterin biosynthesis enzyme
MDSKGGRQFQPDRQASRLKSLGQAQALLAIPESVEYVAAGTLIEVEMLV